MNGILKKALAVAALLAASALSAQAAESLRIVSAANPSGTWYIGMGALGKVYTDMNPDSDVTMLPGGGATNPPRVAARDADIGIAENSILSAFKKGTDPYRTPGKGLSTIINLQDRINYQIASPVDSPVKSLKDLKTMKNLTIGVGSTGGSTDKIFRQILKEYGITYEDIRANGGMIVTNSFDDIANMVKDGQVDVFAWIGPGEAWFIVDISGSTPLKFLSIEPEVADRVAANMGIHVGTLPAEYYKGAVGENITTLWDTNVIFVRDNMSDETAYNLTKAVIEGKEDIARANPSWVSIDPNVAWKDNVFPLHPGAEKYYREKGYMK